MNISKLPRLAYVLCATPAYLALAAIRGLFVRPRGQSYGRYLLYRLIATFQHVDPHREVVSLGGQTTADVYAAYAKKEPNLTPRSTSLDHGAELLWLGPSKPQQIVYYLHGGAYVNPAAKGHFVVLQRAVERAQAQGVSLGVAVLVYDLAPNGTYPLQLRQAVTGLRYLLQDLKVNPSDIIVAGDSAGANLALALMSHLSHPHPNVAPIAPLVQSQQLRGLFLISPWVTFASTADSVRRNADKDYLQVAYLHVASSQYLGGQELDNYNTPLDADPKWWTALPVQAVRVVSGASEVFSDDMKKLVGKLKVESPDVQHVEVPDEVHCQAAVNATVGFKPAVSQQVFIDWVIGAVDT